MQEELGLRIEGSSVNMLGYLILAILAGFIAVDIIRSRPKPQPEVTKKETFVCANCKRELSKEYLFTRGLCINCVMDSYKRNKPEPAIPTPEKVQKETFVCPNCKRELNKKYLYKQGMCVDCVINPQKYRKPKPAIPTPEDAPKETFLCPSCKRERNKKYLYKWGLCVDCVINPQMYHKPAPTSSALEETFVCPTCGRRLNVRYLDQHSYSHGRCVDCVIDLQRNYKPTFTTCCSCGMPVDTRYAVSNACFRYCRKCAEKYFISLRSSNSKAGHLIFLFRKEEIPYEITSDVCMETLAGRPCIEESRTVFRGIAIFSEISYYPISFAELKEIAKNVSEELYEKYKGMNETNWLEYMYKYHNSNIYKFNVGVKFLKDASKQQTGSEKK